MNTKPAVADGKVYATIYDGSRDSCICAFDAMTGDAIWSVEPPGTEPGSPLVSNGLVIASMIGQTNLDSYTLGVGQIADVDAFDAGTGDMRWQYSLPRAMKDETNGELLSADGMIYFGSGWSVANAGDPAGYITALETATGKVVWQKLTRTRQGGAIAVANGVVFFIDSPDAQANSDYLYAADGKTGAEKWETALGPGGYGFWLGRTITPSASSELLYVYKGQQLRAVDQADGRVRWEVDQPGYSFSTPAEEGSAIYIAEDQDRQFCIDNCGPRKHYADYLLKLDSRTGQQLSKVALGEDGPNQLVLQDGILYYSTSTSNTVKAAEASTGRQIWEFGFGIEDAPPEDITLMDHTLFFGVFNGFLYALELPGYPTPVLPAPTP